MDSGCQKWAECHLAGIVNHLKDPSFGDAGSCAAESEQAK